MHPQPFNANSPCLIMYPFLHSFSHSHLFDIVVKISCSCLPHRGCEESHSDILSLCHRPAAAWPCKAVSFSYTRTVCSKHEDVVAWYASTANRRRATHVTLRSYARSADRAAQFLCPARNSATTRTPTSGTRIPGSEEHILGQQPRVLGLAKVLGNFVQQGMHNVIIVQDVRRTKIRSEQNRNNAMVIY